jgi:cell division septal protein FtsQ
LDANHRTGPCKTTRIHVDGQNRRRIVYLSIAAVLLLGILLIAVLPPFRVKEITITGCNMISPDELLVKSGIQKGNHLVSNINGGIVQRISLRYGKIEQDLQSEFPYIDSITIQVAFPSKVVITVKERQKIGYIQIPDGYAVIDMDGYVVELSGSEIPAQVPVMVGIPVRSAVLGHQLEMSDVTNLNTCITILPHAVCREYTIHRWQHNVSYDEATVYTAIASRENRVADRY